MKDTNEAKTFLQVLIDVPEQASELTALFAEQEGARGVEIRDETTLPPPGGRKIAAGRAHVLTWLDSDTDREGLSGRLLARLDTAMRGFELDGHEPPQVSFSTVDAEDWVRRVRETIRPVKVGRRVLVRPSWTRADDLKDERTIEIVLDPGLAFGTGHHGTTALCLEAIEQLLDEARAHDRPPRLLDVGTGSGILAIAAIKMGARSAVGIDNDPMAVKVGRENARENGVADQIEITIEPAESRDDEFEIVVANIHLGPLTAMAKAVAGRVAPGGRLLLSGLLSDQAGPAEKAYAANGLTPLERRTLDGWALVSMMRSS